MCECVITVDSLTRLLKLLIIRYSLTQSLITTQTRTQFILTLGIIACDQKISFTIFYKIHYIMSIIECSFLKPSTDRGH